MAASGAAASKGGALLSQAEAALDSGDLAMALENLRRALGFLKPQDIRSFALRLGSALEKEGKREQAAKILRALSVGIPGGSAGAPPAELAQARALVQEGRWEEAEAISRRILASPASAEAREEAWGLLVYALREMGRTREAIEILKRACAEDPGSFKARADLGSALLMEWRFEEAESVLREAMALRTGDYAVQFTWAKHLRWKGRLEEAAQAYRQAIAARPAGAETYLHLAETLMRQGKIGEMFAALEEARAACPLPAPGDIPGWLERYRLAAGLLDYEEAARIAEAVLDRTRSTQHLNGLLWLIFMEDFEYTDRPLPYVLKALNALDRFVAAHPDSPWGYYYRALMREVIPEMRDGARADLERLQDFPAERYGWMRFKTAWMKLKDEDFEGALSEFALVARSSDPGHCRAQCFVGDARLCLGDLPGALAAFESAEKMTEGKELSRVLAWKGKALLQAGEYGRALPVLDAALKGSDVCASCWRAGTLVKLKRYAEALEELERALAFSFTMTNTEARIWRCEALVRLGRHEQALQEAEAAIVSQGPRNFYAHVVRSLARGASGDMAGMREDFSQVPDPVVDYVRRRLAIFGSSEKEIGEILEKILELSLGVRCEGYELRIWMRV